MLLAYLVVLKHWDRLPIEAGEVTIFGEISSGHIVGIPCEVTLLGQSVELNDLEGPFPKGFVILFKRRI